MNPVAEMKTDPNPVAESDVKARMQTIEDNLQMMRVYFDALFTKDLKPLLDMFDRDIKWLLEYRTSGTLTSHADFPSITIQPTGKKYDFLCSFVFHIRNGKIDRVHEYFDMETIKRRLGTAGSQQDTDFVQAFTAAMTSDDVESMVNLFAPDGEWVVMATGETFRGHEQIMQLATRSVAARDHTDGLGIKPTNVFTNAEGTKLCWEYVHTGVVTDKWPTSSSRKPNPGTKFELPIILMCEIRQGKLIKIREYFDLLTLLEPDTPHRLYS